MTKKRIWKLTMMSAFVAGIMLIAGHSPVSSQATCGSRETISMASGGVSVSRQHISSTKCFIITNISTAYDLITLETSVSGGEVDVYLAEGSTSSFSSVDLMNIGSSVNSDQTFAIAPRSTTYTLGISPRGSASIALAIGNSANSVAVSTQSSACGQNGAECVRGAATAGDKTSTRGVYIGSQFGDSVIMPLQVHCPGPITATAKWTGSASQLALILNGPGQVGYFDRNDGTSGISVRYDVTYADLHNGIRWNVSLVNFNGGTASASIDVTQPAFTCASGALRELSSRNVEINTIDFPYKQPGGWAISYDYNGFWYYNVPSNFVNALREINAAQQQIKDFAFAPNGGWVITYARNGARWDNVPNDFVNAFRELNVAGEDIRLVFFSPSGGWGIIYGRNGRRSAGLPQGFNEAFNELNSAGEFINTVTFTPGGGWIIVFGDNGWRSVGMPENLIEKMREFNNAGRTFKDIAFEPDGGGVITHGTGGYYWYGIR